MTYVALLRGINVGGKTRVEMPRLKAIIEKLGFTSVRTYINSGNVIFASETVPNAERIEAAIEKEFGFKVPVVLRSKDEIATLLKGFPESWVNDDNMKCDVMFLWVAIDTPAIMQQIPYKQEIEDVLYLPGAVIWRIDRDKVTRGAVLKIVGRDVYKQMTVRNPNTVRKLYELMKEAEYYAEVYSCERIFYLPYARYYIRSEGFSSSRYSPRLSVSR